MSIVLEIAVDSLEGARTAIAAGADRLELCAALAEGGTTPSAGFMHAAARLKVPVFAMIRPRGGDFVYSGAEVDIMKHDIAQAREAGLAGVVLGALTPDDRLDLAVLEQVMDVSHGLQVTLHRAFDLVADPLLALQQAVGLGFRRILTSGQSPKLRDGRLRLEKLAQAAAEDIIILPGGGIDAALASELLATGLFSELHAACRTAMTGIDRLAAFGFIGAGTATTDGSRVAALRQAIDAYSSRNQRAMA